MKIASQFATTISRASASVIYRPTIFSRQFFCASRLYGSKIGTKRVNWQDEEHQLVLRLYNEEKIPKEIAAVLPGRSLKSIETRISRYGAPAENTITGVSKIFTAF